MILTTDLRVSKSTVPLPQLWATNILPERVSEYLMTLMPTMNDIPILGSQTNLADLAAKVPTNLLMVVIVGTALTAHFQYVGQPGIVEGGICSMGYGKE
ncbi:hypothetical protein FALCPG4_014831 [Fusarium falciforme]